MPRHGGPVPRVRAPRGRTDSPPSPAAAWAAATRCSLRSGCPGRSGWQRRPHQPHEPGTASALKREWTGVGAEPICFPAIPPKSQGPRPLRGLRFPLSYCDRTLLCLCLFPLSLSFFLLCIHQPLLLQGHSLVPSVCHCLGSADTLLNSQSLVNGNCSRVCFGTKGEPETTALSPFPGNRRAIRSSCTIMCDTESSGLGQAGVSMPAPTLTLSTLFYLSETQFSYLGDSEREQPCLLRGVPGAQETYVH